MSARIKGLAAQAAMMAILAGAAAPGHAYLFWNKPSMTGTPAAGGEKGITLPLAGATSKEQLANLIWTMRAGLNVAALQCQFAPTLRTVQIYNNMLRQHAGELQDSYSALTAYFKRTGGKKWTTAMDQYSTSTYNSFSTLQAQLGFCETAAEIGRDTLERKRGELHQVATARMREFRNSLVPAHEQYYRFNSNAVPVNSPDGLTQCYKKNGKPTPCKW